MRRFLPIALLVLAIATPALAVRHTSAPKHHKVKKVKVKKLKIKKVFPAGLESVLQENIEADKMSAWRYLDVDELDDAIERGELVPLDNLTVSPKLPPNRRFARPATVAFAQQLSREFYDEFADTKHFVPLMVDSAVRPMDVQKKLWKRLGCKWHSCVAAPPDGERASSHERGTTFDISRRMTKAQYRWLVLRLLFYRATHKILVIEERACFHIFVYNGDAVDVPAPPMIVGTIPEEESNELGSRELPPSLRIWPREFLGIPEVRGPEGAGSERQVDHPEPNGGHAGDSPVGTPPLR
jgi:hypothetical protein